MMNLLLNAWQGSREWRAGRYMIMPDHVHLFASPVTHESENAAKWVAYWKACVTRAQEMKNLWQRDCWDTQLRSGQHYGDKWQYIRLNPVRKGLVADANDWPYQGELNVLWW